METKDFLAEHIAELHKKVLMIKNGDAAEAINQLAKPIDIRMIKDAKVMEN